LQTRRIAKDRGPHWQYALKDACNQKMIRGECSIPQPDWALQSKGRGRMIIDTPHSTKSKITKLKNAGVKTIIRYYNHKNSTSLPDKRLSIEEAQAIVNAGLRLAVTFQQRQNQIADFTKEKGKLAGERAFTYASGTIGQPKDSTIYFSVDRDFIKKAELAAIVRFFEGVREAFAAAAGNGPSYKVGAYGSGKVLDHLRQKGLAEFFWLAQSTGWSGFRDFKESKRWHLLQGPVTSIQGLPCDKNDSNPDRPDFGSFTL
jgi:hypothetical protein